MTKPFVLDEDGDVSIVGPPGLERFLGSPVDGQRDATEAGVDGDADDD
ncbi:hypothetical protein [Halapricum hydrolyticum]|uniref:Uncharacterized protein n=1 Tax=Halapricum hydrolyticum TaxID=2979991 RepID=A0AAE3I946_9EURY|nr:hypothetical protein [Halapricum hydrolyticum]MCU4716744.1 hypothetical protein [Halapricum hydrolyticum]MCU4725651.1 hypothetical protein [Halapricum hydrolyticum]